MIIRRDTTTDRGQTRGGDVQTSGDKALSGESGREALASAFFDRDQPSPRGSSGLLAAYNQIPSVRSTVSLIAHAIASTEWYVTRDGERLDSHPLLDTLNNPSPEHSGYEYRYLQQVYYELLGEQVAIAIEEDGGGVNLILFPPTDLTRQTDRDGTYWQIESSSLNLVIRGDTVFELEDGRGTGREIEREDMRLVWVKQADVQDPYARGSGTGRAIGDEIEIVEYAAKHEKLEFANNGRPDFLVQVPGATQDEVDDLADRWYGKVRGIDNVGEGLFFGARNESAKMQFNEISRKLKDMQVTELRDFSDKLIERTWGVPPELLGRLEDANRATIENAKTIFAEMVQVPRLEHLRNEYQQNLVPLFGDDVQLHYEDPVPENKQVRQEVMAEHPHAFTVNEIRDLANLPPREDGEVYLRDPKKTIVEAEPVGGESRPTGGTVRDSGSAETSRPQVVGESQASSREGAKIIQATFSKQPDERVQRVLDAVDAEDMGELRTRFADAMRAEGEQTMDDIGESFGGGVLDEAVEAKVDDRFEWVLPEIADFTRDDIQSTIIDGLDEGRNPRDVARDVRDKFDDDYPTWRAERIARTEMLSASNAGTWNAHKASDVVKMRSWLSTRDGNVRPEHVELDTRTSKNPIAVDTPFEVAGFSAMHPGDFGVARLDVHCRCTTVAEFPNRTRTLAQRQRIWEKWVKRLTDEEQRTKEVVAAAFRVQRDRVLDAYADAFDVTLDFDSEEGAA